MKNFDAKTRAFFIFLIFLTMLFQGFLEKVSSAVSYLDELLCLFACYKYFCRGKINKVLAVFASIFLLMGLISNLKNQVVNNYFYIFFDVFTYLKTFILFYLFLYEDRDVKKYFLRYMTYFGCIFVTIGFFLSILNLVIDIGMSDDVRYGIRAFNYGYSNCGLFGNIAIVFFALFSTEYNKNRRIFKYLSLFLILSTLRSKAFGVAVAGLFIDYALKNKIAITKSNVIITKKKCYDGLFNLKYCVPVIILMGLVGLGNIKTYFFAGHNTPRLILLSYGVQTGIRYFPFGAGFASYGSPAAKMMYSPLYSQYGFNSIWGMSFDDRRFLTDSFFPMLFGELGFIGTLFFFAFLFVFLLKVYKLFENNLENQLSGFVLIVSVLLSTTGSTQMFGSLGAMQFIMLGMVVDKSVRPIEVLNEYKV